MENIKHSSKSVEWYTPVDIITSSRKVLGSIDLDPASTAFANERVRAVDYYDKEDNGLNCTWHGNVFCNPPGGRVRGKSLPALFWNKLTISQQVSQAIFLAFSIELLQTSQMVTDNSVCKHVICFPKRRLKFVSPDGLTAKTNTHASAIIYYLNTIDNSEAFVREFNQYGTCMMWRH